MSQTPHSVLITGATGMLGRAVVGRLVTAGISVRALSRQPRRPTESVEWIAGDVTDGSDVRCALGGVDAVIHLASAPYHRSYTREVEIGGTSGILAEAQRAGIQHIVYTSIIGCDRIPWGYFRTKVDAETLIRDSSAPWTILRLGQFYDFVDQAFTAITRSGVMVADRSIIAQPVGTSDVADRILATLSIGPSHRIEEFAGPEILDLRTAAQQWLMETRKRRPLLPVHVPGKLGRAFRAGHLTTSTEPRATLTWRRYLQSKYASGRPRAS